MQVLRSVQIENAMPVGRAVRALVLSAMESDATMVRVTGLGCQTEHADELYTALDTLMSDPAGFGLFVIDSDAIGGLAAGERAFRLLGDVARRVPVIVISRECTEQVFPEGRESATVLRAPLSAVSLRVGVDHALRARTALYA